MVHAANNNISDSSNTLNAATFSNNGTTISNSTTFTREDDLFKVYIYLKIHEDDVTHENCGPMWDMEVGLHLNAATKTMIGVDVFDDDDDDDVNNYFEQSFVSSRCGRKGSLVMKCTRESGGNCASRGFHTCT